MCQQRGDELGIRPQINGRTGEIVTSVLLTTLPRRLGRAATKICSHRPGSGKRRRELRLTSHSGAFEFRLQLSGFRAQSYMAISHMSISL